MARPRPHARLQGAGARAAGEHAVPHGAGAHIRDPCLHNLVRRMEELAEEHHPRLPELDLGPVARRRPVSAAMVVHGTNLHRPDRRQHQRVHHGGRRARRQPLLPRKRAVPAHSAGGHPQRIGGEPRHPPGEHERWPVHGAHGRRRHDAGLLPRSLRIPLLHLPGQSGLHAAVRVDRQLGEIVPGDVRVPVRHPSVHGRRHGAAQEPQQRRGRGRHGERHRPRARRNLQQPAHQRLVRGRESVGAQRNCGSLRGHVWPGRRRRLPRHRGGVQVRRQLQHARRARPQVPGAVAMELRPQRLPRPPLMSKPMTSFQASFPERDVDAAKLLGSAGLHRPELCLILHRWLGVPTDEQQGESGSLFQAARGFQFRGTGRASAVIDVEARNDCNLHLDDVRRRPRSSATLTFVRLPFFDTNHPWIW